jgi:pimeloyl-ACP methyl ester carboxylesterase
VTAAGDTYATPPTGAPSPVMLHVRVYNPGADRRVLLLHGLGSDGTTCWRLAEEVAAAGMTAVVPDLRNHGLSPTTHDHRIVAYASDVALLSDRWDLVVGHSLGGAVLATLCADPGFAGRALLLDPVLQLAGPGHDELRAALASEVGGRLTHAALATAHPGWPEEDRHRKLLASAMVSRRSTDATMDHNDPWDVIDSIERWACPVHLVAADPERGALLAPEHVARALARPGVRATTITGAGHSVHRDDPSAVVALMRDALAAVVAA